MKRRMRDILYSFILVITGLLLPFEATFSSQQRFEYCNSIIIGKYKLTLYSHQNIRINHLFDSRSMLNVDTLQDLWQDTNNRIRKAYPKEELIWTISYAKPPIKTAVCGGSLDISLTVSATNMNHTSGQSYQYTYPADAVKCDVDVDLGSYDVYKRTSSGSWLLVQSSATDYFGFSEVAGTGSPVTRGCRVVAKSASDNISVFLVFTNAI